LYEIEANIAISDSSWYDRFTPELVEFLHQCVIHGIQELAKEPGRKLSKKLESFQDVLIQDSSQSPKNFHETPRHLGDPKSGFLQL